MTDRPLFSVSEKVIAIMGNATSWIFASISQDFMSIAAGIASISTAAYMITKMILLIRGWYPPDE